MIHITVVSVKETMAPAMRDVALRNSSGNCSSPRPLRSQKGYPSMQPPFWSGALLRGADRALLRLVWGPGPVRLDRGTDGGTGQGKRFGRCSSADAVRATQLAGRSYILRPGGGGLAALSGGWRCFART